MSDLKHKIIEAIIDREGGYVNNPYDSGGKTCWGITELVARKHGYHGAMRDLSRGTAFQIYEERYWASLELDKIERASPRIAEELADTGINMGVGRAAEFLQRSLNVLNRRGELYHDIAVDGDVGPETVSAFLAYLSRRGDAGELVLFRMLNSLQGAFYIRLAERRGKDEEFVFGWFRNRVA